MRKLTVNLAVVIMSLLLVSGLALAQHGHGTQESDSLKSCTSQGKMMPRQKQMMGKGMMGKEMMHGKMGCDMMGMMDDPIMKELRRFGCPGILLKSADQLGLSEKQISDLKALKSTFQKFTARKKADIKVANIELTALLDAERPDFGKVKNKITQTGSLQQDLRLEFLNVAKKSRELLTAEQLKKLTNLHKGGGMGMMGCGMMK